LSVDANPNISDLASTYPQAQGAKVFWFFSSEKNCFLPNSLIWRPHPGHSLNFHCVSEIASCFAADCQDCDEARHLVLSIFSQVSPCFSRWQGPCTIWISGSSPPVGPIQIMILDSGLYVDLIVYRLGADQGLCNGRLRRRRQPRENHFE
jgi:hypothetical protein